MAEHKDDRYDLAKIDPAEFKIGSPCACSLFVFVESEKKYLPFVTMGEILSAHKHAQIQQLQGHNLYVRAGESRALSPFDLALKNLEQVLDQKSADLQSQTIYLGDAMTKEAQQIVREVFGEMSRLPSVAKADDLSRALSLVSSKLVENLLEDSKDVRRKLLAQLRQIHLMNDAAAITTLALLIAHANDFPSKTTARMLSLAALFADAGLADLEKHWSDQYYKDRSQLPTHIVEKVHLHPVRSNQMVAYSNLGTDILSQIILSHHELYSGSGYHRGVQSGSLPTVVQIFALAVDVYERLKNFELNNLRTSFVELFKSFDEKMVDPLKRRHNIKLTKALFSYLGVT